MRPSQSGFDERRPYIGWRNDVASITWIERKGEDCG